MNAGEQVSRAAASTVVGAAVVTDSDPSAVPPRRLAMRFPMDSYRYHTTRLGGMHAARWLRGIGGRT